MKFIINKEENREAEIQSAIFKLCKLNMENQLDVTAAEHIIIMTKQDMTQDEIIKAIASLHETAMQLTMELAALNKEKYCTECCSNECYEGNMCGYGFCVEDEHFEEAGIDADIGITVEAYEGKIVIKELDYYDEI